MKIFLKPNTSHKNNRGFTLVELLVVFFIMTAMLAVVIPGYLTYSTKVELDNLVLDIALTIREAQGYGGGSKVSSTGFFDIPYGVHFDMNDRNHFIFFEDTDKDGWYTVGADTILNRYTTKDGYTLNALCTRGAGSTNKLCSGITYVDITYKRPNPDAIIQRNNIAVDNGTQNIAWIELISPDQATTSAKVSSNGNISIE